MIHILSLKESQNIKNASQMSKKFSPVARFLPSLRLGLFAKLFKFIIRTLQIHQDTAIHIPIYYIFYFNLFHTRFLVDKDWYRQLEKYIEAGFGGDDPENENPGPIDNSPLLGITMYYAESVNSVV